MAGNDIVEEQTQTITATVTSLESDLENDELTITTLVAGFFIGFKRRSKNLSANRVTQMTQEKGDKEDSHLLDIQPSCHSFSPDN